MSTLHILGISGSLRHASHNTGLLRAAQQLAPEGVAIDIFSLADIPLYNNDEEANLPAAVTDLKQRIGSADALLIASPEYNYSFTGVLKNAIDWVSRPPATSPFNDKPGAIIGASGGVSGTMRGQLQLRQILNALNMHLLNRPEFITPHAGDKFDANGDLIDEALRERLRQVLVALAHWTHRLDPSTR